MESIMRLTVFLLLLSPLFSGCAIKPISNESAKTIPSKRIIDNSFFLNQDGKVLIVIKRDQGHVGSACTSKILVDGQPVAGLRMSEKMSIYLTPEQHILSSIPQGICGGGIAELQIDLSSNKPSTFRVGYDGNATHRIQPTAF